MASERLTYSTEIQLDGILAYSLYKVSREDSSLFNLTGIKQSLASGGEEV